MDLYAIEARLAAATPGPWDFHILPQPVGITAATIHSEHGPRETCWTVDLPPEIGGMGTDKDAELIAHAPEDIRALIDVVKSVRELHRKVPLYDTPADECTEHDPDIYGIELDYAGEWYCSQHVAEWVCAECFTDDGGYVEYPCDTMRALGVTE